MDTRMFPICLVCIPWQGLGGVEWDSKVCGCKGDTVCNETIPAAWGYCVGVWGRKSIKKCVFTLALAFTSGRF